MPNTIYDVIRNMIDTSDKPAKQLAKEAGKPYSTLMREINTEDKGAKLGVETLLPLMQACQSIMPLRYLASRMNCRVEATDDIFPDKPTLHEELLDSYDAMAHYHRAIMDREPPEKIAELREMVIRQVHEDFVAYTREIEK